MGTRTINQSHRDKKSYQKSTFHPIDSRTVQLSIQMTPQTKYCREYPHTSQLGLLLHCRTRVRTYQLLGYIPPPSTKLKNLRGGLDRDTLLSQFRHQIHRQLNCQNPQKQFPSSSKCEGTSLHPSGPCNFPLNSNLSWSNHYQCRGLFL